MGKIVQCPICSSSVSSADERGTIVCNREHKYPMFCKSCNRLWYENQSPMEENKLQCPNCGCDKPYEHGKSEGITPFFRDMPRWRG